MATLKKPVAKKAAPRKTVTGKAATTKVETKKTAAAKKVVTKKAADNKPEIKKGSKLACQACGFAFTVDRICGCMEEAHFICCETPMKLKRTVTKKK